MSLRAILRQVRQWFREPDLQESTLRRIRAQSAKQQYDLAAQMETRAVKPEPRVAQGPPSTAHSRPWTESKS